MSQPLTASMRGVADRLEPRPGEWGYEAGAQVLRRGADRIEALEAALREVDDALTCRDDDSAHYCPNCDNSLHKARERVRAALSGCLEKEKP